MNTPLLITLAQIEPVGDRYMNIMVALGCLALAAIVLGVVFFFIRKWFQQTSTPPPQIGFTLADIRQMHAQGLLSDDEFEQSKRQMMAKSRAMLDESAQTDGPADGPTEAQISIPGDPPDPISGNPVEDPAPPDPSPDKNGDEPDRPQ